MLIRVDLSDKIGTISLDHYAKRNALSEKMIGEILAALEQFRHHGVRVVILRSATHDKVWSAGHDVDELPKSEVDPLPYTGALERLLRGVRSYPAPVIAMVHGSVWGGACDLVMNCDLVVGDSTCSFAITPAKLGLPYNPSGFSSFLRLPLVLVKEMFFTAEPISAERAERFGLVNRIVEESELEASTYALARTISSRSAASVSVAKHTLNALSQARPLDAEHFEMLQGMRRTAYFGPDYPEGIRAFRERRPPQFTSDPLTP